MKPDIYFYIQEVSNYLDMHQIQLELVEKRILDLIPDTIIFTQHEPVYSVGRKLNSRQHVKTELAAPLVEVERGGDITFHGPGQLVIYPILKLKNEEQNLDLYLRTFEKIIISAIAKWGIKGKSFPTKTGVWIEEKKIASVGIAVKKWVTYHGAALNVNTDMSYFQAIEPCGYPSDIMTSMKDITGREMPMDKVRYHLLKEFELVLKKSGKIVTSMKDIL